MLTLLASSLLLAQGVFGVVRQDQGWWLTTPSGKKFWAFSVDCVDKGEAAKEFKADNPGFASFRLYDSDQKWADTTTANLKKWGFNSLGGWSDHQDLAKLEPKKSLPYCEVLHLGAYAQIPFHDMFAPAARKAMEGAAKNLIPKLKNDPNLIGYYTDNELGWWGDTLFISYLAMPETAPGKQRLMGTIEEFYKNDFVKFQKDWITDATTFEDVAKAGKLKLRPGGNGMRLINRWLGVMGDFYYKLVHDLVRAQDSRHLILGDRYCQFYEIPIAQASAPYTDVASTNFSATWNDGTFARFYLDGLYQLTQKPIIIGEFYMGAMENRSGNKNVPTAFPIVNTQKERAAAFAENVRELAGLPFVVGAQWFQYYDEPPKGRGDGENFNHGLVDTQGRPYEGMVKAAEEAQPADVHRQEIPHAGWGEFMCLQPPKDPLKDLKDWPRGFGFVPLDSGIPFGDLYVCADEKALYVGVIAMDYADPHLYEGNRIPDSERITWTINLGKGKPIVVKLGADDQKAIVSDPTLQFSEKHGLQHQCLLRIPLAMVGSGALKSSISTHSRGYTMSWRTPPLFLAGHFPPKMRGVPGTRFKVVEENGITWIVKPDGSKMLSRGVCCIGTGETPKTYDSKNPAYASYREYVSTDEWAKDTLARLTDWGFNTVGAWSATADLLKPKSPNVVFTPILHMGSAAGAPWRDMWDPKIVALMDSIAQKQIVALKGESRVMGYFSDNEMGWWFGAMFDWAFKAGQHSRAEFVGLLRKHYGNQWSAVQRDFESPGVSSFEDLKTKGRLYLRPGQDGIEMVHAWMSHVSNRYYSLCRRIIKKYDPGALYLGDRYISNFYPEVAESAGKYCDVVSTNLNADTNDGAFAPFYLNALHQITEKPIMITEYYQAAEENRSGNKNDSSGFPVVKTQAERAAGFKRQTDTILGTPYVVGAHWFQYYDEPGRGRGDGENYDMGLVDVDNRPYERLVNTNRAIDADIVHDHPARPRGAPAPPEFDEHEIQDIGAWINRAYVVPDSGFNARGNLYMARHAGRSYACIYWNEDLFAEAFYQSGKVPPQDTAMLIFEFGNQAGSVHVSGETADIRNGTLIKCKYGVRNYIIFELPKARAGSSLMANLVTRARAYHMFWGAVRTRR